MSDSLAGAFKETLRFEAEQVFLNAGEFAQAEVRINGRTLTAQLVGPQSVPAESADNRLGVGYELVVLHIKSGLIPLPRAGRSLELDGEQWLVLESQDNYGLYRVEIYREIS